MINITQEDWEAYEDKFGGLISFISHRITGDPMVCDFETNEQDLRLAALDSIFGYYKKNKITQEDMAVVEVINCPLFKAYTKTVLWNSKNYKGNKATKYKNFMPISLDTLDNKEDLVCDYGISDSYDVKDSLDFLSKKFNDNENELLSYVVKNPNVIREDGTINFSRIAKDTDLSFYKVKKAFTELMGKFKND
jgi:hypothetical protein|tara:strand:- start:65 stop:643 length:579 start_codon:yes stop_codon:yes gene_type:complete